MLKNAHLIFILFAIIMYVLRFFWLKTKHKNAQSVRAKKIHIHANLGVVLLGAALASLLHFNPFSESGYWLLEKLIAFVAYFAMVQISLKEQTKPAMQWLTFIGALGWLGLIVHLVISKQAIFLVG